MKLFVGNLPFSVDSEGLRRMFEEAGIAVDSASVIEDKATGRSRGFGLVETPDGDKAVQIMSTHSVGGRTLTVNEARPQEQRPRFGGGDKPRGPRRDRY